MAQSLTQSSTKPAVPDFTPTLLPQESTSAPDAKITKGRPRKKLKTPATTAKDTPLEQSLFLDVMRYLNASEDSMSMPPVAPAKPSVEGKQKKTRKRRKELLTSSQLEHKQQHEILPMLYSDLDRTASLAESPSSIDSCASIDCSSQSAAFSTVLPQQPAERVAAPRLTWDTPSRSSQDSGSQSTATGMNQLIAHSVFTLEKTTPDQGDTTKQVPFESLWAQVQQSAKEH